jgi:quercetin dioxygenase-like cupin family protein
MGSQVQIDDTVVRVTRWTLEAREATGPHLHTYDYVVVPISGGQMGILQADGNQRTTELVPGQAYLREAGIEHNVWNAGEAVLDFVEVEVLARGTREGHSAVGIDGPRGKQSATANMLPPSVAD